MSVLPKEPSLKPKIILTCEHADFLTPGFIPKSSIISERLRRSHRGWDQGAWAVCQKLKRNIHCDIIAYPYSRLYLDANRTVGPKALSPWSKSLDAPIQKKLFKLCQTYRNRIDQKIKVAIQQGCTVFIFSIHSFVPRLNGKTRTTDLGLLFRVEQSKELDLALRLRKELKKQAPQLRVHRNLPYRGHTDCLLNDVLNHYQSKPQVHGLFVEINQRLLKDQKNIEKVSQLWSKSIENITL